MSNVIESFREASSWKGSSCVCIGNFDGLHRGHREIIATCQKKSEEGGLRSIVMTFEPHPRKFFQPEASGLKLLLNQKEKAELMSRMGVDSILFQRFDQDFARLTKEEFIQEVLIKSLSAKTLVVGRGFRFAYQAKGRAADFLKIPGLELVELDDCVVGQQSISSSQVRHYVEAGLMEEAQSYLGYPYFITGKVVRGAGQATPLGYPTANIEFDKECRPAFGVYVTLLQDLATGGLFASVTNWGHKPSFHGKEAVLESHLLNFEDELYGRELRLFFLKRLRSEKAFKSREALSAQISHDVDQARQTLRSLKLLQAQPTSTKICLSEPDEALQSIQVLQFTS